MSVIESIWFFNKICLNWIHSLQILFIHCSISPCFMSICVVNVFIVSWFYKNNLLILNHHITFINILIWMQKFKPFWKAEVVYSHESAQVINHCFPNLSHRFISWKSDFSVYLSANFDWEFFSNIMRCKHVFVDIFNICKRIYECL